MDCLAFTLTCILLVLVTILFIAVIILAKFVQQLKAIVTSLESPCVSCSYINPANVVELNQLGHSTPTAPPRPISGTSPWIMGSMESVVVVPSREESPAHERFLVEENVLDMKPAQLGTFKLPAEN